MKITYLKETTGETIDLNKLILENSIELNDPDDLDEIIKRIGESRYVLLGEATHGTHQYYTWRTLLSRKLIEQKGFSFIGVEGDWPDCYKLNRYIKNYNGAGTNAFEILDEFRRWPTWMWANWETVAMADRLRKINKSRPANKKVGFYGLDVYSLWESLEMLIKYLHKKDRRTENLAVTVLKCFEPYSNDEGQSYAQSTLSIPTNCEEEVIDLLKEVRKNMFRYNTDPEEVLNAEQNAQLIANAEQYYRAMVRPGPDSWNIRDNQMVDTLNRLMKYYGHDAKAIIWQHNTHIGDARATDMIREGMVNVGQLVNEQHYQEGVYAVGFGSYKGTLIAAREWGDVMRVMNMPPAMPNSWEFLMHQFRTKKRIVFMTDEMRNKIGKKEFPHRAIGVVYKPELENLGNYVPSLMPYRYDAFIYLDKTTALNPLHIKPDGHQTPETFPFGL